MYLHLHLRRRMTAYRFSFSSRGLDGFIGCRERTRFFKEPFPLLRCNLILGEIFYATMIDSDYFYFLISNFSFTLRTFFNKYYPYTIEVSVLPNLRLIFTRRFTHFYFLFYPWFEIYYIYTLL